MSLELRQIALQFATSIHKETAGAVDAAKHFYNFLLGDGTEAPKTRGRKAVGESNGVALTPEQIAAAAAAAQSAPAGATATASTPVTVVTPQTNASDVPPVKTAFTLQQVADKIVALVNSPTGGRDKAVAILTKYGVKKVPEIKPENFEAVMADIAAAEAPATGAASLF